MDLIDYLNHYFLTTELLISQSKTSNEELLHYQESGLMPKPSYQVKLNIESRSFFGEHQQQQTLDYYAKGYLAWLGIVQTNSNPKSVYQIFSSRYKDSIEKLRSEGHSTSDEKLASGLEKHIAEEWQYFLDGTYGLCTASGLPEDIAAKEFAICEINQITKNKSPNENQIKQLTKAVNLLDSASALFAPHERQKSSRQRLINDVRREYKL